MDGTPGYTTLDFGPPGLSSSYFSKGSKKKCSGVDHPIHLKDGSTLVLGLGPLSSCCTTVCSGKEMEGGSTIDLGINLKTGDKGSFNPKNLPPLIFNVPNTKKPDLDLQLSLSTGPAESDLTTVTQGFTPYQHFSESPSLAHNIQGADEGSISSRWKIGPLVPPLPNVDISVPLVPLNISSTAVGAPSLVGSPSGQAGQQKQRKANVKTCRFEGGCTRGARGASGLCIAHGGGRRCQKHGCQKGAEGKTVFCKAHGGGRRCQHLGCTKSAEGRTDYCIGHGGGRRCSHDGCSHAARGKSGLCIRHGGGKRCQFENCTKSAEGISGLCISHGGGRRCQYPDCKKGAQGSTMFCKAHGGGRRCTYLGCMKGAEGSTSLCKGHGGGKRCTSEGCTKSVHGGTLFCVSHGGGKRCAEPGCTKSARGRTSYCVRHGGGKRCKSEGCTKSAQGSTDFCKAHGGGKRCSWVFIGVPCDKFARGKSGLCAAHSAQVGQESEMNESFEIGSTSYFSGSSMSTQMNDGFAGHYGWGTTSIGYGNQPIPQSITPQGSFTVGNACLDHMSLPEGRVHGGGLMAMLRGGSTSGTINNNQDGNAGKSCHLPHSWM